MLLTVNSASRKYLAPLLFTKAVTCILTIIIMRPMLMLHHKQSLNRKDSSLVAVGMKKKQLTLGEFPVTPNFEERTLLKQGSKGPESALNLFSFWHKRHKQSISKYVAVKEQGIFRKTLICRSLFCKIITICLDSHF